jgi:hypothetical protein
MGVRARRPGHRPPALPPRILDGGCATTLTTPALPPRMLAAPDELSGVNVFVLGRETDLLVEVARARK